MSYIIGRGLHKFFPMGESDLHVLKGIDVTIERGQFTAIMGASGSGKSTLMYLLGGLDQVSEGEIVIGGQRVDRLTGDELAHFRQRMMGFIFQQYYLVPTMNVLENVALPGIFGGLSRDRREERAFRLLDYLGMAEKVDQRPNQLSGGQQQRVAIARALFTNPPIIMGDEPTGALDSKTGTIVMRLLRTLATKHGKTVIVVSHDASIERWADRMLFLRDGQIERDWLSDREAYPDPLLEDD
ncbi:MAG TPA: ABC transporter ATP-binding protein, partial [Aggregatilineales bacterium]|nr:ABC transporter ATP-binding protein [Aggregatilineales bacterium]